MDNRRVANGNTALRGILRQPNATHDAVWFRPRRAAIRSAKVIYRLSRESLPAAHNYADNPYTDNPEMQSPNDARFVVHFLGVLTSLPMGNLTGSARRSELVGIGRGTRDIIARILSEVLRRLRRRAFQHLFGGEAIHHVRRLQPSRNTRVDSHFPAPGLPHRHRGIASAYGWPAVRDPHPFTVLLAGLRSCHSRWPRRGGAGGSAGADDGPIARRIGVSHGTTKQQCCSVVGHLVDAFDNDVRAVSSLQHSRSPHPAGIAFRWRRGGRRSGRSPPTGISLLRKGISLLQGSSPHRGAPAIFIYSYRRSAYRPLRNA